MALAIDAHQQTLHSLSQSKTKELVKPAWTTSNYHQTYGSYNKTTTTRGAADIRSSKIPIIPDPEIFAGLTSDLSRTLDSTSIADSTVPSSTAIGSSSGSSMSPHIELPSIAQCAVHLELLLCFSTLRETVEKSTALDRAFTIIPRPMTVQRRRGGPKKIRDPTFDTRRQKKWPVFLKIAVGRFFTWIKAIDRYLGATNRKEWTKFFPPPLDVLMVWHALLLNPSYYIRLCKDLKTITQIGFPWEEIHEAINSDAYTFKPSASALAQFQKMTSFQPDVFEWIKIHSACEPVALNLAKLIEGTIPDSDVLNSKHVTTKKLLPESKTFLRFCGVETGSNAETENAADAVTRQYSFCQKMELQLWIRSPAVHGTLTRARTRYGRFLKLFKLYPKTMLVPTLDIDLVWHTHQLSHQRYANATKILAGTLIDHNDKLGTAVLNDGMERTGALYRIRFGGNYQVCNCWECEALTSEMEKAAAKSKDWATSHVDDKRVVKQVSADLEYYRLAETARRNGKPAPCRYSI